MYTPWYMPNISYIVGKQHGCPVVAYCSPNSLLKEATLPPHCHQFRSGTQESLITDLEAIDKPQILPDQPDQTKIEKTRSDFPKELSFPPFEKTRSVSQQPRANFRPGPEL